MRLPDLILTNIVDDQGHLLQLIRTDVRTMRESEIDQQPFAMELL